MLFKILNNKNKFIEYGSACVSNKEFESYSLNRIIVAKLAANGTRSVVNYRDSYLISSLPLVINCYIGKKEQDLIKIEEVESVERYRKRNDPYQFDGYQFPIIYNNNFKYTNDQMNTLSWSTTGPHRVNRSAVTQPVSGTITSNNTIRNDGYLMGNTSAYNTTLTINYDVLLTSNQITTFNDVSLQRNTIERPEYNYVPYASTTNTIIVDDE